MKNHNGKFLIAIPIIISLFIFSSCAAHKYEMTVNPNIRIKETLKDGHSISKVFQMHDSETDNWYEAQKNNKGECEYTPKGQRALDWKKQMQFSSLHKGGDGGGGGGCQ